MPISLHVDQRSEPRYEIDQAARATILGETEIPLSARVLEMSGQGLRLTLNRRVSLGTAVRVDLEDSILLGEVCYCRPRKNHYVVGLLLEHSLAHTAELARLMRRLVRQMPNSVAALVSDDVEQKCGSLLDFQATDPVVDGNYQDQE